MNSYFTKQMSEPCQISTGIKQAISHLADIQSLAARNPLTVTYLHPKILELQKHVQGLLNTARQSGGGEHSLGGESHEKHY